MKKNKFSKKIEYLFNRLEQNREEFIQFFWNGDKNKLNTRTKTVNNWLDGDIENPKGFKFDEYKISKWHIEDATPAFTKNSFVHDSFDSFKLEVDRYIRYEALPKDKFEYEYIYYYDSHLQQVTYVSLNTIKKVSDREYKIEVILSKEYDENSNNVYSGTLVIDKNYYHISAKNHFEILSFYFILNLGFKNDDSIYGLRLGKAYGDGLPLSAKNLLTKKLLNEKEEKELYLNINETEELKSKEAFYDIYSSQVQNYRNRFYNKIANLATYTSNVREILNEKICHDIYHNIMSKEFYAFSKISKLVQQNNSFYIHNIRRASKIFLRSSACKKDTCYIVSPLIENLSLLNEHDLKAEESLQLNIKLAQEGLQIYRIFVVNRDFKITKYMKDSIQKMIDAGISVRVVKKEDIEKSTIRISYDFIYNKNKNIAIYRKPTDRFYIYYITKNKNVIKDDIDTDYKTIKSKSYSFNDFLKEEHQTNYSVLDKLVGEFYHYSYGSKNGKDNRLHFWNSIKIVIDKYGKIRYLNSKKLIATGRIVVEPKQTTIMMVDKNTQNSISINFENTDINYEIFSVIKLDKQYMENRDMTSLGLFSRKKLDDKTAKELLGEEDKSIFRVPIDIKRRIARYCTMNLCS